MQRSANCKAYTDSLPTLVTGTASIPDKPQCRVDFTPTFSCQTSAFEKPDPVTSAGMVKEAEARLQSIPECGDGGVVHDFYTNQIGSHDREYSPARLVELNKVSNCFADDNDNKGAMHMGYARCSPMETFTDKNGNRVKNTNLTWTAQLQVCDLSDKAMAQVQEDLRKAVSHTAALNGNVVDSPTDLACKFSFLPTV